MRNCCAASEYHPKNTDVSSGYGVDGGAGGHDVVIVVVWLFDNTKYYYYQNK